jgi:calcyphosin
VRQAFTRLDKDGSGIVDVGDILKLYNASKHPDVIAGRKTPEDVFNEFLSTFETDSRDGRVTFDEFKTYYTNLSASMADDDTDEYFELCIRNAWHMGAENTASRRMLVTDSQGNERVVALEDDLGLQASDSAGYLARLRASGMDVTNVTFAWANEDKKGQGTEAPGGLPPQLLRSGRAPARPVSLGDPSVSPSPTRRSRKSKLRPVSGSDVPDAGVTTILLRCVI